MASLAFLYFETRVFKSVAALPQTFANAAAELTRPTIVAGSIRRIRLRCNIPCIVAGSAHTFSIPCEFGFRDDNYTIQWVTIGCSWKERTVVEDMAHARGATALPAISKRVSRSDYTSHKAPMYLTTTDRSCMSIYALKELASHMVISITNKLTNPCIHAMVEDFVVKSLCHSIF